MKPSSVAALAGTTAVMAGVAMVAVLHVVPPSSTVDPIRRTISEYALLSNGWVFDLAVLLLAGGSAVILASLLAAGLARPVSPGTLGLTLWSVGLAAVVVFPKHNWAIGPSSNGDIHRVASLVAFLSLPIAAIAVGGAWRRSAAWRGQANTVLILGFLSLVCFSPLAYAILTGPATGVRWWRAIPLGAVERAIALTEVVLVLAFGGWAARAAARPAGSPVEAPDEIAGDEYEPAAAVPASK